MEGVVNVLLDRGVSEEEIEERLVLELKTFKELGEERAREHAKSVLEETKAARKKTEDRLLKKVLSVPKAGATMHDLGVGCRGGGDFYVHRLIAGLASKDSLIPPEEQDDAGAVEASGRIIVSAIDGTHSRLSDFPFIAGFHVARAAMRDVMVKGAKPVALIDDLHLGDDGDVGKLFDFVAGVSAVGELTEVPLIAGSTLRIGGDMVIGDRMVSGVGCIGVAKKLLKRADVRVGDAVLMTQGAGGGTIATTALYSGNPEIVKETLNIDFITAANTIFEKDLIDRVHSMLDVTNGGLRGDANEVCKTAKVGIELKEIRIRGVVNERVLSLLDGLGVDYLGVSLDSLLVFCPQAHKDEILGAFKKKGIVAAEVGAVVKGEKALLDGKDFSPKFRESAYTPIKKMVGECAPEREEDFRAGAREAAARAREKMREVIEHVEKSRS